jgi:hypothetical protein
MPRSSARRRVCHVALTIALALSMTAPAFADQRWQHKGGWNGGRQYEDWGHYGGGGGDGIGIGGALLGFGVGAAFGAALAAPPAVYYRPPPPVYYGPPPVYYGPPPVVYYGR